VVPRAMPGKCDWQIGMTAEITGLTSEAGKPFNGLKGRILDAVGERWEVMVVGSDGIGTVNVKPRNLIAAVDIGAVIATWRLIPNRSQTNEPTIDKRSLVLHEAVEQRDAAKAKSLVDTGTSLCTLDDKGRTALHLALEQVEEKLEEVEEAFDEMALLPALLVRGAHVNALDRQQCTPLHMVLRKGLHDVTPMLLEAHADPTMEYQGKSCLHLATIQGDASTIRLLLQTPVMPRAQAGGAASALEINGRGTDGWTPLGLAARSNNLAAAEALLQFGADPHVATRADGKSALDIARTNQREAMLTLLTANAEAKQAEPFELGALSR